MKKIKNQGPDELENTPWRERSAEQLTVQEFSMKHGHSRHTSNELEIGEVVLITQARVGVDLQSVVVPVVIKPQREGSSGCIIKLKMSLCC